MIFECECACGATIRQVRIPRSVQVPLGMTKDFIWVHVATSNMACYEGPDADPECIATPAS